eukprot:1195041-Prymnesium_polylepis.1
MSSCPRAPMWHPAHAPPCDRASSGARVGAARDAARGALVWDEARLVLLQDGGRHCHRRRGLRDVGGPRDVGHRAEGGAHHRQAL